MRKPIIFPGQKVITTSGEVVIVSHIENGQAFAHSTRGIIPVTVCGDAWGGEHDQEIGLAA